MGVSASDPTDFLDHPGWPYVGFALANGYLLVGLMAAWFTVVELLVLYWLELVIIGVAQLARLLVAASLGDPFSNEYVNTSRAATLITSALLAGFFIAKYGTVVLVMGLVLVMLPSFFDGQLNVSWISLTENRMLSIGLVGLLFSHGISFVESYLVRGGYRTVSVLRLLFWPYARGLGIGLVMLTALLYASLHEGDVARAFTFAVFGIKTGLDLLGLTLELRGERARGAAAGR
jgi:hypothetical protein